MVTEGGIHGRVLGGDRVCRVPFPGSAGGAGVLCDGGFFDRFERIRLNRKTHAHLARHVVWEVYRLVPGFGRD